MQTRSLALGVLSLVLFSCNSNDDQKPIVACTPVGRSQVRAVSNPTVMSRTLSGDRIGRHIPARVTGMSDRGRVENVRMLPVTVALALNNEDELDQRIADVYEPGNPRFHQFITPQEFRARYAPTPAQIQQAKDFLDENGIRTADVDENGYLIRAFGTAAALSQAFRTEIHQYQDEDGKPYFAPSSEPEMPKGLSIRAVHGLHNVSRMKPRAQARSTDSVSPRVGRGPNGGLSPADIRSVYNLPSSVDGSGQVVALVELDGYQTSDITAYARAFGLPSIPLQNVYVDGASGAAGANSSEVTLDIELVAAVAPGVSKIMVYESPNTAQSLLNLYSRIANDNQASIVSISWGAPESTQSTSFLQTENAIFKQMALQGQSVYAASGDSGAMDNGSSLGVDDPSSQPFVVAVGGTHLNTMNGIYYSETTWNSGSASGGAGGGGVSSLWVQPSWQNGVASGRNLASSGMRNTPDVSLNADPSVGYSIYHNGRWVTFGGTSCGSPLWAGFTALVNQKRAANGVGRLGFPNPHFYSIGKGSRYGNDFHDIQDGSTNLYYPAVPGYDSATGWGSFNGQGLFEDLIYEPAVSEDALSC